MSAPRIRVHTIQTTTCETQSSGGCSSRITHSHPPIIINLPQATKKQTRMYTTNMRTTQPSRKRNARAPPSPRRPPPPPPHVSRAAPARQGGLQLQLHEEEAEYVTSQTMPTPPPVPPRMPPGVAVPSIRLLTYIPGSEYKESEVDRRAKAERERLVRWRIVAGMLLSRGSARPMSRRVLEGPRPYVRSGLSSVVEVDA
ncbi:hypothetical protein BD410DRAFT_792683 [Rickenella mellea]|uniref:Uncharacterized protein n=1 Tax=Rickenella mellea TaxID=50990 RepID=A0A4Y7PWI6_9AGAM|nr:hypothetical protein BD410DRAFT_792683 [Rickenella mellea]